MKPNSTNLTAGILLSSALFIAGCASDPIDTSTDRNEEYNREFIKAFGVPSTNHNWSDAEKTSLTIKSTQGAAVKVYYESDGQLFLTGDLTVASGSQQIPFIIPDGVTTLKVEANGQQYDVRVGSTLDLDNTTPSRAFGTSAEYNSGWKVEYATDETSQRENCIKFLTSEISDIFFEEFPIGQENLLGYFMKCISSSNESNPESASYYIYPIFWRNRHKEIATPNEFRFGTYDNGMWVWFDNPEIESSFPSTSNSIMCFGTQLHPVYNFDNDFWSYGGILTADDLRNKAQAYEVGKGYTSAVISQGIKIKSGGFYPALKFGEYGTTSAESYRNRLLWQNRYWNLHLVDYNQFTDGYSGVVCYTPKDSNGNARKMKFKVWRKQEDGNYCWEERERTGYFIGFSAPPEEIIKNGYSYGDDTPCDFCDAVFFVTAEDEKTKLGYGSSGGTISTSPSPFLIAAEDLGGSYDWDFNDAVFEVSCVTRNSSDVSKELSVNGYRPSFPNPSNTSLNLPYVYQIEVTPLAAGGTMPIYIAYHGKVSLFGGEPVENIDPATTRYNDIIDKIIEFQNNMELVDGTWIVGTELHKWLGASGTNIPINVGEKVTHTGRSVKFYVDTQINTMDETTSNGNLNSGAGSSQNLPLLRFSVIVDRDNALGIDTSANFDPNGSDTYSPGVTKFNGTLGEGTYKIDPVSQDKASVAPQMLCYRINYWEWPQEKHSINLAYPRFADWVSMELIEFEAKYKSHWWADEKNAEHTVKR